MHTTNLNFCTIYQQSNLIYNIIPFIFNLITKKIYIAIRITTFDRLSQKNESHQITRLVTRLLHSLRLSLSMRLPTDWIGKKQEK